jgi:ferredoxin
MRVSMEQNQLLRPFIACLVVLFPFGGSELQANAFPIPAVVASRRSRLCTPSAPTMVTNHDYLGQAFQNAARKCTTRLLSASSDEESTNQATPKIEPIDVSVDPRLTRVRLSRILGIEWGTDLSFSFVYVRNMDPMGEAAMSNQVNVGDQLCELIPVVPENSAAPAVPVNLLGASFDFVMESFAVLDKTVQQVDLVFFRGSKDELKALVTGKPAYSPEDDVITVTVIQDKGSPQQATRTLTAPRGVNLRQLCIDNNINVYQSLTRWTNCKGKQLCGTCIVNVTSGSLNTNRKSMDEVSTLRENPDSYRLSCITFAYGDVTLETFPPVKASQWTR